MTVGTETSKKRVYIHTRTLCNCLPLIFVKSVIKTVLELYPRLRFEGKQVGKLQTDR